MPLVTTYQATLEATCDACGKEGSTVRKTNYQGACVGEMPVGFSSFVFGGRAVTLCEPCSKKAALRVDDKAFPLLT